MSSLYNSTRTLFTDFFKENAHAVLPSGNLVPEDPSLLFTNSGMVQFKDYFLGKKEPSAKRATTVQKCVRAGGKHNDLDNVGYTNRHHTFFEMLGNFSFGDYFKEEAIFYAWKFLTDELGISREKLYITVFHDDVEAYNIWHKLTGFGEDRILKIPTADNFWSMGPTGPCGPCSEIFYDYGAGVQGDLPGTSGQDGARYTEIWNLVFMQYNQLEGGERLLLEKKSIDTGMGLERLISVLENKVDNYNTSLFQEIIGFAKDIVKRDSTGDIMYRIMADHVRSAVFLIADGVMPSNEGRGYVLRRIIRRALRHIYLSGFRGACLGAVAGKVIELMKGGYPEILERKALILSYLEAEEARFNELLPAGLRVLEEAMKSMQKSAKLPGERAFVLYDTYGFPLDITEDILRQSGFAGVDEAGFEAAMEEQKKRSKEHWRGSGDVLKNEDLKKVASTLQKTEFVGYETLDTLGARVIWAKDNLFATEKTPFYPEGGGQVGDVGTATEGSSVIKIIDTVKAEDVIFHKTEGAAPAVDSRINLAVDRASRRASRRAHSATHLLHHFLREQFGETVVQRGSFVEPDRLRFDFSFPRPFAPQELADLEGAVNEYIVSSEIHANISEMPLERAKAEGVLAMFGEKYRDVVRVVKLGKSKELCGGTHVHELHEIGSFKIVSESLVSSGVRRIEALVGEKAIKYLLHTAHTIEHLRLANKLPRAGENWGGEDEIATKFNAKTAEIEALKKACTNLELKLASSKKGLEYADFYIKVTDVNADSKQLMGIMKGQTTCKVLVLAIVREGKFTITVSSAAPSEFSAIEIAKKLGQALGAKGTGGKELMATTSGLLAHEITEESLKLELV